MRFANRSLLCAALLLTAACTAPPPEKAATRLADSRWTMIDASFGKPDGVSPTFELLGGRILAHSGCNRASGAYQDIAGRLDVSALMSTRMGCRDALSRFETDYYRLLSARPAYRLEGDTLTLVAGEDRARFLRAH